MPFGGVSVHAEVDALRRLKKRDWKRAECELYVCRIDESAALDFKLSLPCVACRAAIEACGITKVYFTATTAAA